MPSPYSTELHAGAVLSDDVKADKIPISMDTRLAWRFRNTYFFEAFLRELQGGQRKSKKNMQTHWFDVYPMAMIAVVTADSSTTSLSLDHPNRCHRDDVLYNVNKNELCLVQEDVGGTAAAGAVSVVGISGSGNLPSTWNAGDVIRILGESHAEGEAIPPAYSDKPVPRYTYLMQRDRTLKDSDIATGQAEYGEHTRLINRRKAYINYKAQWVMLMYFGQKNRESVSGDGRRHVMSGMREQIESNIIDFGGVPGGFTLANFGEVLRRTKYTDASSDMKMAMIGTNALAALSAMPMQFIQTTVSEDKWGKYVKKLLTPHGECMFRFEPQFTPDTGSQDAMLIFDAQHVEMLKFADMDDKMLLDKGNRSDIHNQTDIITGTCGLALWQEQCHAWAYGIQ